MGDIEEDGELRALTSLYQGDTRAAGLRGQAAVKRVEGAGLQSASRLSAGTTLLKTGAKLFQDSRRSTVLNRTARGSMLAKYGGGFPQM